MTFFSNFPVVQYKFGDEDTNDLFRNFFLRECRKKRVFLLDSYKRFPKKDMDKLIIERKISNTIKKFEEML